MAVRPFRLYGSTALQAVAAVFENQVREWAGAWGIETSTIAIRCMAAPGARAQACWRERWSMGERSAWCDWSPQLAAQVQGLMFAPWEGEHTPRAGLAPAMAEAALDALLSALRTHGGADLPSVAVLQPAPDWAHSHGSGYVLVDVAIGNVSLRMLLDERWTLGVLAAAGCKTEPLPRLQPVGFGKSIDAMPIALTVVAGHAELGAGALLGMQPGDVLRLGTAADAPFTLAMPSGQRLGLAYIGRMDGRLAVEMAPAAK